MREHLFNKEITQEKLKNQAFEGGGIVEENIFKRGQDFRKTCSLRASREAT